MAIKFDIKKFNRCAPFTNNMDVRIAVLLAGADPGKVIDGQYGRRMEILVGEMLVDFVEIGWK